MPLFPPTPILDQRGTVINNQGFLAAKAVNLVRFALRKRGFLSSSWFGRLSVLPEVMAIHTIEMIPKSMIFPIRSKHNDPTT